MLLCIVNAHARDMCPSVAKPGRSAPAAAPPAGQPAAPYERSCSWGVSHSRRSVPTPRASHHSPLARLWVVSLDRRMGWCPTWYHARCHTSLRGRSRQDVSLREGYPTRPRAGRTAAARRARGDQLLRAVLLLGGVRAASAWTWPGRVSRGRSLTTGCRLTQPTVHALSS